MQGPEMMQSNMYNDFWLQLVWFAVLLVSWKNGKQAMSVQAAPSHSPFARQCDAYSHCIFLATSLASGRCTACYAQCSTQCEQSEHPPFKVFAC